MRPPLRSLRRSALVLVAAGLVACSGRESATGPGEVSRVDISAPRSSLEVGQTVQLTVRYYDAQSTQLTGHTIAFATMNPAVASVTQQGLVTAVGAGNTSITATVGGVEGSLPITVIEVPVAYIVITPSSPTIRQGETIALIAQPNDGAGNPLTARAVSWSSADPARATVSGAGVVTGIAPGYVYVRASTQERTDSVNLRVRSLVTPAITAGPTGELVPGAIGTLTG